MRSPLVSRQMAWAGVTTTWFAGCHPAVCTLIELSYRHTRYQQVRPWPLMTSLKFGTSGLRGLAVELVGDETRRYTAAFLRYLSSVGESAAAIYLGRDLRASSEAIYHDCAAAAAAMGLRVVNCGVLAAPALACHAMAADAPSIMITGSHIPADRNGLKFSRASREISKLDEIGIIEQLGEVEGGDYKAEVVNETIQAAALYIDRYRGVIAEDAIKGWRTGVYEHSTAGRGQCLPLLALRSSRWGARTISLPCTLKPLLTRCLHRSRNGSARIGSTPSSLPMATPTGHC